MTENEAKNKKLGSEKRLVKGSMNISDFKRSMDSGVNDESVSETVSAFAQQMSEDMPAPNNSDSTESDSK